MPVDILRKKTKKREPLWVLLENAEPEHAVRAKSALLAFYINLCRMLFRARKYVYVEGAHCVADNGLKDFRTHLVLKRKLYRKCVLCHYLLLE